MLYFFCNQIKLKEILREHFARHEAGGKSTRAIVFTQFRDSVEVCCVFVLSTVGVTVSGTGNAGVTVSASVAATVAATVNVSTVVAGDHFLCRNRFRRTNQSHGIVVSSPRFSVPSWATCTGDGTSLTKKKLRQFFWHAAWLTIPLQVYIAKLTHPQGVRPATEQGGALA